jgi:CRISPR/Cas system-associated exonuclease Cas4 (RecB family)
MQECPRCFWLEKHKVWKRPAGIFPSLPGGMDKILKEHFDRFREQGKMPPELCEKGECSGMKLFPQEAKLKIWQNNRKGVSFTDKKGNELHGAVDNVLVKGKKLIVLDYKTRGYALKEDTHEHYQLQLDVYNYLLSKNDWDTEDYGFLLFYIPKEVTATGEVLFDTELVKMKTNTKHAEKVWKEALKLLNGPCPPPSKDGGKCVWCEGR